jgi:hypothetical protein
VIGCYALGSIYFFMDFQALSAKLKRMWDPRTSLAKEFQDSASRYEEILRANNQGNQQVVESILQERRRIQALFQRLLPEFKEKISVVVTKEILVEHCSIFSWNEHIYVLVSAALIGRPFDHPELPGTKAWDWLAQHEIYHIKSGHTSWLFHVRRLYRITKVFFLIPLIFYCVLPSNHLIDSWFNGSLWLFYAGWSMQMIVSLIFEYKADLQAARSIKDPLVLEDAEQSLSRMTSQAINSFPQPLGWLNYLVHLLFIDPHPPFVLRQWLLRKYARLLRNGFTKPAA